MKKILLALLICVLVVPAWAAPEPTSHLSIISSHLSKALRAQIEDGVHAVLRQTRDVDGTEVEYLRRQARQAVISVLQVNGYFSPTVNLTVTKKEGQEQWVLNVDTGIQTRVSQVNFVFKGGILQPAFAQQLQALKAQWQLKVGQPFLNSNWSSAKNALIEQMVTSHFYLAHIVHSQATIDPVTGQAVLMMEVDSGPAITLGEVQINGLKRIPESLVRRYIHYKPGTAFSQGLLDQWQNELINTNFFRGVFITLGKVSSPEMMNKNTLELPVQVNLIEGPNWDVQASVGIETDVGASAEVVVKKYVVAGLPITLNTGASLNQIAQKAFLDIYLPPYSHHVQDSFGFVVRNSLINNERVDRIGVGWRRTWQYRWQGVDYSANSLWRFGYDIIRIASQPSIHLPTTVYTIDLMRRHVDDIYEPTRGDLQVVSLGAGYSFNYRQHFWRVGLRSQLWFPITQKDVFSVRFELGKVFAKPDTILPDDFGYRTGGPRSIPGYRYLSIGKWVDGAIIGARSLAVVGAQYIHYFNDRYGIDAFYAVGDANESFRQMRWSAGYGLGGVIRTPAGPFEINMAWAQREKRLRVEISLGVAF